MPDCPVRILHLSDIINRYDFIDNVVRGVDPGRFEVQCATFRLPPNVGAPCYENEGISHTVLNGSRRRDYPRIMRELLGLIRRGRIQLIHAHHFDPNLLAWLATAVQGETRLVVGRHYSDLIYQLTRGVKRSAYLALEGRVNSHADRIVVPSTTIRDLLVFRQGVTAEKVKVVPYAVDLARYESRPPFDAGGIRKRLGLEGSFLIATVGRLDALKGHAYLFEALQQLGLPDTVLLVVGDGPLRAELETAAAAMGISGAVRFLGWRTDTLDLISATDAVVQPTLSEAFSSVMVEAMALGVPLVMSAVSGAVDLIENDKDGLLVPKGDTGALATAILRLYQDSWFRASIGAAAREKVFRELSVPRVVPQYEQVYLEALAGI